MAEADEQQQHPCPPFPLPRSPRPDLLSDRALDAPADSTNSPTGLVGPRPALVSCCSLGHPATRAIRCWLEHVLPDWGRGVPQTHMSGVLSPVASCRQQEKTSRQVGCGGARLCRLQVVVHTCAAPLHGPVRRGPLPAHPPTPNLLAAPDPCSQAVEEGGSMIHCRKKLEAGHAGMHGGSAGMHRPRPLLWQLARCHR